MKTLPLLLIASSLAGQALPEGYADHLRILPANAGNVLHLPAPGGGALVWFDGTDLVHEDTSGTRSLLTFALPVYGSFTIAAGGAVLFGENSTGGIWLAPRNGVPPMHAIAQIPYNYDAVLFTPNLAIVSAKTGGFGSADNDLIALDLTSGATQIVARVPGASGPVAVPGGTGDLYYATGSLVYPTPPGQTAMLRFPRAALLAAYANHQVLSAAHAQVVMTGIDSASAITCDDDHDLLFVDWFQNAIGEIDDADGPHPTRKVLSNYAPGNPWPVGIQFVAANGNGVFEPFQQPDGALHVHESDFSSTSQVRTVAADAAVLTSSVAAPVPTGPFALQVAHGPANGLGLVAIDLLQPAGAIVVHVTGFEQPLLWHHGLLVPANTYLVTFDAAGNAVLPLHNPGFSPAVPILTQAAFLNAAADTIGATAPLQLPLGT